MLGTTATPRGRIEGEGILIGAIEFDVGKNAAACSGFDCRAHRGVA